MNAKKIIKTHLGLSFLFSYQALVFLISSIVKSTREESQDLFEILFPFYGMVDYNHVFWWFFAIFCTVSCLVIGLWAKVRLADLGQKKLSWLLLLVSFALCLLQFPFVT